MAGKSTTRGCILKNDCQQSPKHLCCHLCRVKDCWQRCKDDITKCKYATAAAEDTFRPIVTTQPKPEEESTSSTGKRRS